ncbi:hypothetical protein EV14_2252 [Prochlorococcus sp. MIT 0703]|nr:hypothetical protein EV12_1576 [Prochlorococcus sp. MIT 0701]KGG31460.1 hypothetical protein EV14_2252 [Prochlorococcus sp. MIT 0703]
MDQLPEVSPGVVETIMALMISAWIFLLLMPTDHNKDQ